MSVVLVPFHQDLVSIFKDQFAFEHFHLHNSETQLHHDLQTHFARSSFYYTLSKSDGERPVNVQC